MAWQPRTMLNITELNLQPDPLHSIRTRAKCHRRLIPVQLTQLYTLPSLSKVEIWLCINKNLVLLTEQSGISIHHNSASFCNAARYFHMLRQVIAAADVNLSP